MYMNPVLVGVFGTLLVELIVMIIYAVFIGRKDK